MVCRQAGATRSSTFLVLHVVPSARLTAPALEAVCTKGRCDRRLGRHAGTQARIVYGRLFLLHRRSSRAFHVQRPCLWNVGMCRTRWMVARMSFASQTPE